LAHQALQPLEGAGEANLTQPGIIGMLIRDLALERRIRQDEPMVVFLHLRREAPRVQLSHAMNLAYPSGTLRCCRTKGSHG
jgi:hypothetical protein